MSNGRMEIKRKVPITKSINMRAPITAVKYRNSEIKVGHGYNEQERHPCAFLIFPEWKRAEVVWG